MLRCTTLLLAVATAACTSKSQEPTMNTSQLRPALQTYAARAQAGMAAVPAERKAQLDRLAAYVRTERAAGRAPKLVYICTHNSRRSHLGQLFGALAAAAYGVPGVETFSGGTEVTAFNPRAVAALQRAGFEVDAPPGTNPHYQLRFASAGPAQEAFSKHYADPPNPTSGFAAIMTCSAADESCPIVKGAALRVPLHYEDPKASDGTPEEAATYDARALQIATEAFYLFSRVASPAS